MNFLELNPGCEIRFVVNDNEKIEIELIDGTAEFFGTELIKKKIYTLTPSLKGSIFTFNGCKLAIKSNTNSYYLSNNNSMLIYKNTHDYLEKLRKDSILRKRRGPIVLICGPNNVGKSTLSKILLNYAANIGHKPIFVDLDCGQGSIGLPGTIGYLIMEKPFDIGSSYDSFNSFNLHFGDKTPSSNCNLFLTSIKHLSELVLEKLEEDSNIKKSGLIINTCGWITGFGYRSLVYAIKKFKANIVLTIDEIELNKYLRQHLYYSKVYNLPKSTGVILEDKSMRDKKRYQRIHNYFYGLDSKTDEILLDNSFEISFDLFNFYQIIDKKVESNNYSPAYIRYDDINLFELEKLNPTTAIINNLLIVTKTTDLNEIFKTDMNDYVYIKNVNVENKLITLIFPQNQSLNLESIFVLSKIKFLNNNLEERS